MTKLLKFLLVTVIAMVAIPLTTSCSDDDEPNRPEFLKATDWSVDVVKAENSVVTIQCNSYKSEWGVYYSTEKSSLTDIKNLYEHNYWGTLDEINVTTIHTYDNHTRKIDIDRLAPNTTYYYIAYYYTFDDRNSGNWKTVEYTDIQSFTTVTE